MSLTLSLPRVVKRLVDSGAASEAELTKRFEDARDAYQRALNHMEGAAAVTTRYATINSIILAHHSSFIF